MTAPIHSAGNNRPWEQRPSDHLAAERAYRGGPLQPLETPRRSFWQRVMGRGA